MQRVLAPVEFEPGEVRPFADVATALGEAGAADLVAEQVAELVEVEVAVLDRAVEAQRGVAGEGVAEGDPDQPEDQLPDGRGPSEPIPKFSSWRGS